MPKITSINTAVFQVNHCLKRIVNIQDESRRCIYRWQARATTAASAEFFLHRAVDEEQDLAYRRQGMQALAAHQARRFRIDRRRQLKNWHSSVVVHKERKEEVTKKELKAALRNQEKTTKDTKNQLIQKKCCTAGIVLRAILATKHNHKMSHLVAVWFNHLQAHRKSQKKLSRGRRIYSEMLGTRFSASLSTRINTWHIRMLDAKSSATIDTLRRMKGLLEQKHHGKVCGVAGRLLTQFRAQVKQDDLVSRVMSWSSQAQKALQHSRQMQEKTRSEAKKMNITSRTYRLLWLKIHVGTRLREWHIRALRDEAHTRLTQLKMKTDDVAHELRLKVDNNWQQHFHSTIRRAKKELAVFSMALTNNELRLRISIWYLESSAYFNGKRSNSQKLERGKRVVREFLIHRSRETAGARVTLWRSRTLQFIAETNTALIQRKADYFASETRHETELMRQVLWERSWCTASRRLKEIWESERKNKWTLMILLWHSAASMAAADEAERRESDRIHMTKLQRGRSVIHVILIGKMRGELATRLIVWKARMFSIRAQQKLNTAQEQADEKVATLLHTTRELKQNHWDKTIKVARARWKELLCRFNQEDLHVGLSQWHRNFQNAVEREKQFCEKQRSDENKLQKANRILQHRISQVLYNDTGIALKAWHLRCLHANMKLQELSLMLNINDVKHLLWHKTMRTAAHLLMERRCKLVKDSLEMAISAWSTNASEASDAQALYTQKLRRGRRVNTEFLAQMLQGEMSVRVSIWHTRALKGLSAREVSIMRREIETLKKVLWQKTVRSAGEYLRQMFLRMTHDDLCQKVATWRKQNLEAKERETHQRETQKLEENTLKKAKRITQHMFEQFLTQIMTVLVCRWHMRTVQGISDAASARKEEELVHETELLKQLHFDKTCRRAGRYLSELLASINKGQMCQRISLWRNCTTVNNEMFAERAQQQRSDLKKLERVKRLFSEYQTNVLKRDLHMRIALWRRQTLRDSLNAVAQVLQDEAEVLNQRHFNKTCSRAGYHLRELFSKRIKGEVWLRVSLWHKYAQDATAEYIKTLERQRSDTKKLHRARRVNEEFVLRTLIGGLRDVVGRWLRRALKENLDTTAEHLQLQTHEVEQKLREKIVHIAGRSLTDLFVHRTQGELRLRLYIWQEQRYKFITETTQQKNEMENKQTKLQRAYRTTQVILLGIKKHELTLHLITWRVGTIKAGAGLSMSVLVEKHEQKVIALRKEIEFFKQKILNKTCKMASQHLRDRATSIQRKDLVSRVLGWRSDQSESKVCDQARMAHKVKQKYGLHNVQRTLKHRMLNALRQQMYVCVVSWWERVLSVRVLLTMSTLQSQVDATVHELQQEIEVLKKKLWNKTITVAGRYVRELFSHILYGEIGLRVALWKRNCRNANEIEALELVQNQVEFTKLHRANRRVADFFNSRLKSMVHVIIHTWQCKMLQANANNIISGVNDDSGAVRRRLRVKICVRSGMILCTHFNDMTNQDIRLRIKAWHGHAKSTSSRELDRTLKLRRAERAVLEFLMHDSGVRIAIWRARVVRSHYDGVIRRLKNEASVLTKRLWDKTVHTAGSCIKNLLEEITRWETVRRLATWHENTLNSSLTMKERKMTMRKARRSVREFHDLRAMEVMVTRFMRWRVNMLLETSIHILSVLQQKYDKTRDTLFDKTCQTARNIFQLSRQHAAKGEQATKFRIWQLKVAEEDAITRVLERAGRTIREHGLQLIKDDLVMRYKNWRVNAVLSHADVAKEEMHFQVVEVWQFCMNVLHI